MVVYARKRADLRGMERMKYRSYLTDC